MQTDSILSLVDCWYDSDNPEVSIVVLNWNKAQLTIECLKSLFEHTQGIRYEIIVVDNGSRAEEFAVLSEYKGPHRLLRLGVNRFFGEGNNLGAELAKGEFVMFMNNDVTVTPSWLLPLIEVFRDHPECGAAGPKFVYPHGMLQEAGALIGEDGDTVQIGKFQDPASPRFNRMRVVDYVSAASVVMRKRHFDQVLGFDFIYEPAYYEDVDLCMKIGELGFKTFYVPGACVVHHENATTADPNNGLNLRGLVQMNRSKFVRRWTTFLKTARHEAVRFARRDVLAAAQKGARLSAAVYTTEQIDSGEPTRHLFSMVNALDSLGYSVSLLTPERVSRVRMDQIANVTGEAYLATSLAAVKDLDAGVSFDVFIAKGARTRTNPMGVSNYLWVSTPEALTCLDADNMETALSGYQGVVMDSGDVAGLPIAASSAIVINPGVKLLPGRLHASRKIIVSEGQFVSGEGSNRQDLMIHAFRRLVESGLKAELHLAGSLLPDPAHREYFLACRQLAEGMPVHFHIDVARDELDSLYGDAFVYWHGASSCKDPGASESIGLSALQAMSSGAIPLIAFDSSPVFVVSNALRFRTDEELARCTQSLFAETDQVVEKLSLEAQAEAKRFSRESAVAGLRSLLERGLQM